ncbi:MAG: DUF4214 domain-containing protein [Desulfacinum sp.]|nr:DUF4214 domain-containing protein [Desulfacinum sp.]
MALTAKQFIEGIYVAYFGRAGDPAGVGYWLNLYNQGQFDFAGIAENFAQQEEATDAYAYFNAYFNYPGYEISDSMREAFVTEVYQNLFNRAPDADGLAYWLDVLESGASSPGAFIAQIINAAYEGREGASADDWNNLWAKIQVAEYYTDQVVETGADWSAAENLDDAQAAIAGITASSDLEAAFDAVDSLISGTVNVGQTFTLTTSVDNITGTGGNDTIIAGEGTAGGVHTLGSSDVINGGAGTDTIEIRLADGQTVVPNMQAVERMVVQAVGTNATADEIVNMINVKGVTEIVNRNSTNPVTITNLQEKAKLVVEGGNGNWSTRVAADTAAARTGDLAIELKGGGINNLTVNQTGVDAGGVAGNPTATITATGTNTIQTLELGNTITTLTIGGTGSLKVTNNTGVMDEATLTKIDASGNEGGVTVSTNQAATGLTFLGGKGGDQITFAAGTLSAADSVDGGAGTDRIIATQADLMAAAAKISNVEIVRVSDVLTGVVGGDNAANLDASKFAGATTFELAAGYAAAGARIDNLNAQQQRVDILAQAAPGAGLQIDDGGTAATNDQFTVAVGQTGVNAAANAAVNFASGTIEVINVISNGDANAAGGNALNIIGGTANIHTLNISGAEALTLTTTGGVVQTIDAQQSSGGVDVTGVVLGGATTFKMGSGADRVQGSNKADTIQMGAGADTVLGSQGADTITLGDGADTVVYSNLNQSSNTATDVITDFVSGTDVLDLSALGVTAYAGSKASFALAQGALPGGGTVAAVFQADENRLWVDMDGNGTLDANDFRVVMQGVSSLAATSVITGAGALSLNLTSAPNDNLVGGPLNDTITGATSGDLVATDTVDGGAGTNTLTVTGNATATNDNNLKNVQVVNWDSDAAGATQLKLAGQTEAFTINVTWAGADNDTLIAGDGNDTIVVAAAGAWTTSDVIDGGGGTDTLKVGAAPAAALADVDLTNVENIVLTAAIDTTNLTKSQSENLNITGSTGNDTISAGNGVDIINIGNGGTDQIDFSTAAAQAVSIANSAQSSIGMGSVDQIIGAGVNDLLKVTASDLLAVTFVSNGGTFAPADDAVVVVRGSVSGGFFTSSATGSDTMIIWDADTANGTIDGRGVVLVGVVVNGVTLNDGADTITISSVV